MLKEYYRFIKEYFLLVELKIKYVVIVIVSALFDKCFSLLIPFFCSLIISSLTNRNEAMSYFYLFSLFITYILYDISLYINYKVYGFNVNFCYNQLTTKVLNKLVTVDHNFTRTISKGRLMNSINSDIIDIGDMNDRISELITGLIQIIALLVIVGFYNIYIAIIFILFSIIYIIVRNNADRKINFYHNKVSSTRW